MNRTKTKTRRRNRRTRRNRRWRSSQQHQLRFENLEDRRLLSADPVVGWEPPAALNSNAATDLGIDMTPQLATDSAGTWVAAWYSRDDLGGTIGTDSDVFFSRSTDNGKTWSDPASLNKNAATDTGSDAQIELVTDSQGTWFAAWWSEDSLGGTIGEDKDILIARSVDNGLTWSDPQPLNTTASTDSADDFQIEIATDSGGHWVAVWRSNNSLGGTIGDDHDILFSRLVEDGETWTWTNPTPLNNNADSDTASDGFPEITTDLERNWIVVWSSADTLGGSVGEDSDILFARSTDFGASWSDPAPLNNNAYADSGSDSLPQIAVDAAGNWIAAWNSYDPLDGTIGEDRDILFARSTDGGSTWTSPAVLNTNAASDEGNDSVHGLATDSTGNWVAVWESKDTFGGTIGDDYDILFSHSTDCGQTWTDAAPLSENSARYDYQPKLATDSSGNWIAVWHSNETLDGTIGDDDDILFSRLKWFEAPETYNSTDTPKSIRDGGWWWSTETDSVLSISGTDDQVGSLVLDLAITHSDPTDLSGYLVSPAGTSVRLFDRVDTIPSRFYLSSDFYEEAIDGNWTFEIWDHARRDTGTLNSWSLTIAAQLDNLPPEINSTPVTTATEDAAYSYDVDATDPDVGDALTFSLDTAPAGMSINASSGLISWTPTNEQVGGNPVLVRVTDAGSAYDTQSFSINVANTNGNPVITSNPVLEAAEDSLYEYDVDANDPDVGDVLTFSLDVAPAGMTIDTISGLIGWTPTGAQNGDQDVTVRVTDAGSLFDTQAFTISVSAKNWPPAITSSPVETALEDSLYEYDIEATDPNSGQELTCSLDAAPVGMTIDSETGLIQWSPDNSDVGDHAVIVRVEDPFAEYDTQEFTLTVVNVNDAPTITSAPITTATEGEAYSYDVNASDPGVGDSLTFSLDTAPANMTIDAVTGEIEWAPNDAQLGDNAVVVRVTDNGSPVMSDTQSFTVTVDAAATGPQLAHGVVSGVGSSGWTTVMLPHDYDNMVVIATPNYDRNDAPGVTRIQNANGNSFQVRVDTAGGAALSDIDVHYVVVEAGEYDEPGYKMEAVKFTSTRTDENNSWVGESRSYLQSYSNPVVVGQVMSYNDSDWSVFWACGSSRTAAPSSSALKVGKHVGEDADTTRADETIGYLVIETSTSGTAKIDGFRYVAALGGDSIRGVDNSPSYNYSYNAMPNSKAAVVTMAAMDGGNGGWAVLYGDNPITPTGNTLKLAVDEDRANDSERKHTTEQVAYFIIDPPAVDEPLASSSLDVNRDGLITAMDALSIINRLHDRRLEDDPHQWDTNGDQLVTRLDALMVINYLNREATFAAESRLMTVK
jgi:subtilisin-like proprotein convertase family protein